MRILSKAVYTALSWKLFVLPELIATQRKLIIGSIIRDIIINQGACGASSYILEITHKGYTLKIIVKPEGGWDETCFTFDNIL